MLEANEGLENIFENALKEAEKRKHEYVTIEHVLIALIKDEAIGTVLHDFKIQVGALIKDIEDYLDTKCNDILVHLAVLTFLRNPSMHSPFLIRHRHGDHGLQALGIYKPILGFRMLSFFPSSYTPAVGTTT